MVTFLVIAATLNIFIKNSIKVWQGSKHASAI